MDQIVRIIVCELLRGYCIGLDGLFCEFREVVDVTAVRQYKVPGTLDRCDVVDSVLDTFLGDRRPVSRHRTIVGPFVITCCN